MTTPEAAPPTSATPKPATSWRDSLAVYLQPRVLIVLLLGFSSGLPLALSGSTLLVWMHESGVDFGTIGLFALVGTPYTLKFLWAPLVDALHVPLFTRAFGRRRGWLLFSQLLLIVAILLLAPTDPARSPLFVALGIGLGKRGLDARDDFDAGGHTSVDLHDEAIRLRTAANVMFTFAALTGAAGVLFVTLPVGLNKSKSGAGALSIAAAPTSVQLVVALP